MKADADLAARNAEHAEVFWLMLTLSHEEKMLARVCKWGDSPADLPHRNDGWSAC